MDWLYPFEAAIALTLQILLVFLLVFGPIRRYPIVFLYSAVYLLTSGVEVLIIRQIGKNTPLYSRIYWTDEIILDLLLFLMVIILTFQATRGSVLRGAVSKVLFGVVLVAMVLPFVIGSRPYFSLRWFRLTGQILNFGGAIMNLGLWTALIGSKNKDPQLLAVSAGLGIAVTGQAIYYGLRLMTVSRLVQNLSDLLNVLTYIAGVAIWCWAFRPAARRARLNPAGTVSDNA